MARYVAPVQGKLGQIIDVITLLVMAIGALYIPLWFGLAGSAKTPQVIENPTWESLGQDGDGQRVARPRLDPGRNGQKLGFGGGPERHDVRHLWTTMCQRPGLVEGHDINLRRRLDHGTAFHQEAAPRARGHSRGNGSGDRNDQRARATDQQ